MNKKRLKVLLVMMLSLLLIFAACSNSADSPDTNNNEQNNNTANEQANETGNEEEEEDDADEVGDLWSEPVTLRVAVGASEEMFEEIYKKPAEEAFPNLTVEQVDFAPNKEVIEEAFMAGVVPDIIYGGSAVQLHVYEEYDLLTDHDVLIERHNFDIDLYNAGFIELIRSHSKEGELWALPIDMTRYALHYNKDIFDMFGVEYPEDGMTWQEVVDLARRVTGERNGVQYYGLMLPAFDVTLSNVSAPLVDPNTDEPLFTEVHYFADLFRLYEEVYINQGVDPATSAITAFIGDRNLAMLPTYFLYSGWTGLQTATEEGMNWDIVTFPIWDKDHQYGAMAGGRWLAVTDYSEYKDQAFQVMAFWLDRERVVEITESTLTVPYNPSATQEFIDEHGVDELIQDKNISALFKYPTLENRHEVSKYQYDLYPLVLEYIDDFIQGGKDINTLLRELNEAAKIRIDEIKAQN